MVALESNYIMRPMNCKPLDLSLALRENWIFLVKSIYRISLVLAYIKIVSNKIFY